MTHQTARKGDLLLVEKTERSYYIGQATTERTTYTFGVVASATRDGDVKTWRSIGYGDALLSEHPQPVRYERRYVISFGDIDVMGVLAAAKAHHYPNHPGQPMPFDSLEEARECARPFRHELAS